MIVQRVKCDNPCCGNVALPESEKKPYVPPYGWIHLKGNIVGCGPRLSVEVCNVDCLGPAVAAIIDKSER